MEKNTDTTINTVNETTNEIKEFIEPTTIQGHIAVVDQVRAEANALNEKDVRDPDIPTAIYLDENRTVLLGVTKYYDEFVRAGFTEEMLNKHRTNINALSSVQRLWRTELRGGLSSEAIRTIEEAEFTREELVAAAVLALRHNEDGKRRIALIREGEGTEDLIADLDDGAVLVNDYNDEFIAINQDPVALSQKAAAISKKLVNVRGEEKVGKTLKGYKEMRDRIYILCKESEKEIRAFATFIFRNDKTSKRRKLFSSDYLRRGRNHRKSINSNVDTSATIAQ